MADSIVLDKAIKFALRIVNVYRYLTEEKHEYVLSKQLLMSAAYIAKHCKTAVHSHARPGFSGEMYKALEKGLDTDLWLLLLKSGEFLNENQYTSLNDDCVELIKLTSSISKATQRDE